VGLLGRPDGVRHGQAVVTGCPFCSSATIFTQRCDALWSTRRRRHSPTHANTTDLIECERMVLPTFAAFLLHLGFYLFSHYRKTHLYRALKCLSCAFYRVHGKGFLCRAFFLRRTTNICARFPLWLPCVFGVLLFSDQLVTCSRIQ
jgi:hypothetical protein